MLQRSRRLGVASPLYPLDTPSPEGGGTGMVMVIGLWNFLLLGSTVTIGLNVALFPRIFFYRFLWHGLSLETHTDPLG